MNSKTARLIRRFAAITNPQETAVDNHRECVLREMEKGESDGKPRG